MATWQPLKKDVIAALAAEILQNYSTGRIAVDGDKGSGERELAENLAAALRDSGRTVTVADSNEDFSTDLLLVAGERLQVPELAGKWRYAIWVEGADEPDADYDREVKPRVKANAIIDNRDPEHPRRRFADSC
ncbi:MAG: hypothetical protein JWN80_849 [Microbacteriaceae bacterium]|jgi:hypothetical protein|nr:hypothetical protein [Microbacteriaceae bacterium]